MRLIDADNFEVITDHRSIDFMHGVEFVFGLICDAPTVDAVPVVHARWISLEPEIGLYGCSKCDWKIIKAKCNFCPNCGADMRECVKNDT